jgi:hypothetical protein
MKKLTVFWISKVLLLNSSQHNVVAYLPETLKREEERLGKGNHELPFLQTDVTLKLLEIDMYKGQLTMSITSWIFRPLKVKLIEQNTILNFSGSMILSSKYPKM